MSRAVRWLRALLLAPLRDLDGPERVVLFAVLLLRVVGIGWGLPASDGWDVDGIAPRDFLPGLVETFTPGHYFTYPPFHLALLALLTLPVTVVTLLRAPSMAPADVVPAFLGTGTMTAFAILARLTSLMMSLGIVLVMGRISEAVFGTRRARVWAMAFAGTEAAATYYAHTTNLDLPMLFWGALAILAFIRAMERSSSSSNANATARDGERLLASSRSGSSPSPSPSPSPNRFSPNPNYLRRAAVFAAFAIASKDQGYALFAIAIPTAVVIWMYGVKGGRAVISGPVLGGEEGGRKRFAGGAEAGDKRLSGEGAEARRAEAGDKRLSGEEAEARRAEAGDKRLSGEAAGADGAEAAEKRLSGSGVGGAEAGGGAPLWRRLGGAAAICVGLVLVIDGALFNPSGFAARVRFLTGPASQDFAQHARTWAGRASALTDTVLFLPNHYPVVAAPIFLFGIWMALRGKRGLPRLVSAVPLLVVISFTLAFNCVARRVEERFVMPQMQFLAVYAGVIGVVAARWVRYAAGAVLAWALRDAATIDANMLGDARYGAEEFMRTRFAAGDSVETYGSNVYLPRFPSGAGVRRVGVTKGKNPMPGITEVQDSLGDVRARSPRWIVVPQGFAWRYLQPDHGPDREGRILPAIQREHLADADTTDYVRSLFAEKAGYRLAAHFHYAGNWLLPPRPLHASLATDVYIFERQ